jgi:hypothetical protein
MADKKPAPSEGGGAWLGITIEILAIVAVLAVVVFGFTQPFNPTFLNLDYLFGKMYDVFRAVISFFVVYDVGTTIKLFAGLLVVFLVALNFYLLLRLLEMEEEHEDHVYHHAEDSIKPNSLVKHVIQDARDFVADTTGLVTGHQPHDEVAPEGPSNFDKLLYWDEADMLQKTSHTPDMSFKHEVDEKEGSSKWRMVLKHAASRNPSDWKLAIIEADTILDALVERSGFPGTTLGERLKNADKGVFRTLDYAWEAHKIRNRIAHEGSNFVLSERDAKMTIRQYEEVFQEFGYI